MKSLELQDRPVFFMADAHLGLDEEGEPRRIRALSSFFEHISYSGGALVIAGDFFDFWFEYRTVIPSRHFDALSALKHLASSGAQVVYVGGNHDFWVGRFLTDSVGLSAVRGPLTLFAHGKKIYVAHGDGLAQRDTLYPVLRGVLHSRFATALFGLVHPDVGLPIARCFSKLSRGVNPDWAPEEQALWNDVGAPLFREGYDAVVLGHIHRPMRILREGRSLFVLGDWVDRFTYLLLAEGDFRQMRWEPPEDQRKEMSTESL